MSDDWHKNLLTCPECLDVYKTPKELPCMHIFCKTCLDAILGRSPSKLFIECLTCHKQHEVPVGGVSHFPNSVFTNNILEAWIQLNPRFTEESLQAKARAPLDPKICPQHTANELKLFCETCQVVICFQCTLIDHKGHRYDLVTDILEKNKEDLQLLLGPVESKVADAERVLAKVSSRYQETFTQRETIEQNINAFFDEAQLILNARRKALLNKLHVETKDKLISLDTERNRRKSIHNQLYGSAKLLKEAIARNDMEMLQAKENIIKLVNESSKEIPTLPDRYLADTEVDVQLSLPYDFTEKLSKVGEILVPDPSACVVSGPGLTFAEVGQTSIVTMAVNTRKGEPFQNAIKSLESELVFQDDNTTERCDIKKREFNTYKIHYTPTKRGKQFLHIKINQKHVRGSPFSITARLPVKKLGKPVKVIGNLIRPWGVTTTQNGDIIVSECQKHVVRVCDGQGREKRIFGDKPGSEKTQFYYPCGVAVDGLGNIYIADTGNRRIQKLTSDGCHIAWAGKKGEGAHEFIDPKDIVFNMISNRLYIADSSRVQVLDPNLVFCGQIGSKVLKNAFGIACDTAGNIYVSDNKNRNIQKFTHDGKLLSTFNSSLRNSLPASCIPITVAVDTCGFLYVVDEATCKIFILDTTGTCVASFGREGGGEGEFRKPHTISVDEAGKVYVCDNSNNRLQVF